MTTTNKRKTNGKNKNKTKNGGPARGRPGGGRPRAEHPYETMVRNPCAAELIPGIYGSSEGTLARFKNVTNNTSSGTCGYCVWFPDYCQGGNSVTGGGNLYIFTANATTIAPNNTVASPLGEGSDWAVNGAGFALPDPAYALATGDIVKDLRTISACMRLTYYGALSTSSGQIGFIENFTCESLLTGGTGAAPPSVDDVFQTLAVTERLGIDTLETVWRPSDHSRNFRSSDDVALSIGLASASATTLGTDARSFAPRGFGFAWRGLDISKLNFEFIKNVEWRPEAVSGLVTSPVHTYGSDRMPIVVANLDKKHGQGWVHRAVHTTGSAVSSVAKAAWTGVSNVVSSYAPQLVEMGAGYATQRLIAGGAPGALALL